jgi:hypothetical protein
MRKMSRDFLGGRAARNNTPVPGHWLLDLPSLSPQIHIRRYVSASSAPEYDGLGDMLHAVKEDVLEAGWRRANGGEVGFEKGVAGVLEGCCATVVANEEGKRELWCFQVSQEENIPPPLEESRGLEGMFDVYSGKYNS